MINVDIVLLLGLATAANNSILGFSQGGNALTFEYIIPIFLIMIFAAALFSSKTKIPHTMILLGFGICISLIGLFGIDIPRFIQFNISPNLVVTFIIPPLIFEAMMNVDKLNFIYGNSCQGWWLEPDGLINGIKRPIWKLPYVGKNYMTLYVDAYTGNVLSLDIEAQQKDGGPPWKFNVEHEIIK